MAILAAICFFSGETILTNRALEVLAQAAVSFMPRVASEMDSLEKYFGVPHRIDAYVLANFTALLAMLLFMLRDVASIRRNVTFAGYDFSLSFKFVGKLALLCFALWSFFFYDGLLAPIGKRGLELFLMRTNLYILVPAFWALFVCEAFKELIIHLTVSNSNYARTQES